MTLPLVCPEDPLLDLLFTVFINDLPDSIKSTARLFADDTVVYNAVENRKQLQKDLHALEMWEKTWKIEFNALKCKHVKFSRKRQMTTNYTRSVRQKVLG